MVFKINVLLMLLLVALTGSTALAAVDLTEAMSNSSQLSEDSRGTHFSNAIFETPIENLSITDTEMVLAPPFHDAPIPAGTSAGSHGHAVTGAGPADQNNFSMRHVLTFAYAEKPDFTIAPVLDLSQPISGTEAGKLSLNDPQLKFSFKNFFNRSLMIETIRSGLMISLYAPVSDISRAKNALGAISVSFTPRIQFHDSRYSLSGLFSLKNGLYARTNASDLISSQGMVGLQSNYRVSPRLEPFIMNYANFRMGAHIDMTDAGLPPQTFSRNRDGHTFGLMTGLKFEASKSVAITPRLNWFMDQPFSASTLGLNLMIHLI